MKISLVPTLEHLCCAQIVAPLFNDVMQYIEVYCLRTSTLQNSDSPVLKYVAYSTIENAMTQSIQRLVSCVPLQRKLESFITPLFCEIEEWIKVCNRYRVGRDYALIRGIMESIPHCWLYDGTIDQEKSVTSLVKNQDIRPLNRFIFACTYCLFDDVLEVWDILLKIEKAYLRHKSSVVVKRWADWLDSDLPKNWQSFVGWVFGTTLWHSNVYTLKRVFQGLSPTEQNQYLSKALIGGKVSSDIMQLGLSIATEEEQELVFRENPVEVFKSILIWPYRSIFFDILDACWPYLSKENFCAILHMILQLIKNQNRDFVELVLILRNLWKQSPPDFQIFARKERHISKPLSFVLDHDLSQDFPFSRAFSTPHVFHYPRVFPL